MLPSESDHEYSPHPAYDIIRRERQGDATTHSAPRVLLAEDDEANRRFLATLLSRNGYVVTSCATGTELLDAFGARLIRRQKLPFDLIISDIRMPGATGMEILGGLHEYEASPPIILFTAFGSAETKKEAEDLGAAAFFNKPFDPDQLLATVRRILPPDPTRGPPQA